MEFVQDAVELNNLLLSCSNEKRDLLSSRLDKLARDDYAQELKKLNLNKKKIVYKESISGYKDYQAGKEYLSLMWELKEACLTIIQGAYELRNLHGVDYAGSKVVLKDLSSVGKALAGVKALVSSESAYTNLTKDDPLALIYRNTISDFGKDRKQVLKAIAAKKDKVEEVKSLFRKMPYYFSHEAMEMISKDANLKEKRILVVQARTKYITTFILDCVFMLLLAYVGFSFGFNNLFKLDLISLLWNVSELIQVIICLGALFIYEVILFFILKGVKKFKTRHLANGLKSEVYIYLLTCAFSLYLFYVNFVHTGLLPGELAFLTVSPFTVKLDFSLVFVLLPLVLEFLFSFNLRDCGYTSRFIIMSSSLILYLFILKTFTSYSLGLWVSLGAFLVICFIRNKFYRSMGYKYA